ncbi:MAG: hypothetical protein DDT26_00098 [Dehalococcoidia bacterium]|nr:hypothetical protein [Chloroflexota bacterium]
MPRYEVITQDGSIVYQGRVCAYGAVLDLSELEAEALGYKIVPVPPKPPKPPVPVPAFVPEADADVD